MKCIFRVTDKCFGLEENKVVDPIKRRASRGIVVRDDGKIAVFCKQKKNEYKLPGGGIEGDESPEEAFLREILEEAGCHVNIEKQLGYTEEIKSKSNFVQHSSVFVGKVIGEPGELALTEKEKAEGGALIWVEPNRALELISNCVGNLKPSNFDKAGTIYSTMFVVERDKQIVKYYIENELNKKTK